MDWLRGVKQEDQKSRGYQSKNIMKKLYSVTGSRGGSSDKGMELGIAATSSALNQQLHAALHSAIK